ncbi:MAG TPA: class IV adenylate cyclase [Planctomycetaceae bacterium]|nr:class IV adenylate cyclase [Planctomycetaceae bacterium]
MNYEVEQKFPVADLAPIEADITALGASISDTRLEVDLYFNHPARDFAQTDEAIRLRRVGPLNRITYKGPKVDAATKTRKELELPLPDGESTFADWSALLGVLGFVPVGEVRKERRKAWVEWEGRRVEVSLDRIAGLGEFVELELVVPPDEFEPAKACIHSLADRLELTRIERRSYLCLLLERQSSG